MGQEKKRNRNKMSSERNRGGIREFNSVDEWIDHSPTERRGNFSNDIGSKWKENQGKGHGRLILWMHKLRAPAAVWQHDFPTRMEWTDKKTQRPTVAYWGRGHTCFEAEETLAKQYYRDNDGYREHPPEVCPLCKLTEYLYQQIVYENMDPATEVFGFTDCTDSVNNRVLHAAPLVGLHAGIKKLPDALKDRLEAMRIRDAYREKATAECQYVLTVVNHEDVRAGVQLMKTKKSVAEKIQLLRQQRISMLGKEKGDFFKTPRAVVVIYDADAGAKDAKNYYNVMIADEGDFRVTPEIEHLLTSDPPAFGSEYQPFNARKLRALMEHHARIDLPFDEIFGEAEKEQVDVPADLDAPGDEFPFGANAKDDPKPTTREPARQAAPKPGMLPCDNCGKMMMETDAKCPHCGAEYELEAAPPPPPPPKPASGTGFGNGRRSGI